MPFWIKQQFGNLWTVCSKGTWSTSQWFITPGAEKAAWTAQLMDKNVFLVFRAAGDAQPGNPLLIVPSSRPQSNSARGHVLATEFCPPSNSVVKPSPPMWQRCVIILWDVNKLLFISDGHWQRIKETSQWNCGSVSHGIWGCCWQGCGYGDSSVAASFQTPSPNMGDDSWEPHPRNSLSKL